jgi:hypothetical protein
LTGGLPSRRLAAGRYGGECKTCRKARDQKSG